MTRMSVLSIAACAAFILPLHGLAQTAGETQAVPAAASSAPVVPDTISRAAAVYGTYQSDVGVVKDQPLSSEGDISSALTNLGGQNSGELSKGWLAYSALVASQSPEFRANVRDIEGFYGRDRVLIGLRNDIGYARTLEGGDVAVGSALTAIEADTRRINTAAAFVKEQAYSLQAAGWAKAKLGDSSGVASRIGQAAQAGRSANPHLVQALASPEAQVALTRAGNAGAPSLWDGLSTAATAVRFPTFNGSLSFGGQKPSIQPGQEATANRIATLAAYRVLGVDGPAANQVQTALTDQGRAYCLKTAQLNLQQCVAASYKQYEVPFCISEHALTDVGDCIDDVLQ